MAAKKTAGKASNGHQLEQAMATLFNNQALLVGQMVRTDERFGRIDDRFPRIEREFREIKAILRHHQVLLEGLPEAICQKIGLATPQ